MTASGAELARGRALHPGSASGPALVLEPLSFWGGLAWEDGKIIDVHHPACGRSLTGTVLVMPHGRGSSSAAAVMAEVVRRGTGPAAVVVRSTDVILVVGALAAAELYGVRCPVVQLDADAFAAVAAHDGEALAVEAGDDEGVVRLATPS
jgi:predicted aconitase with swiveling domain